jgi:hypothetical protein
MRHMRPTLTSKNPFDGSPVYVVGSGNLGDRKPFSLEPEHFSHFCLSEFCVGMILPNPSRRLRVSSLLNAVMDVLLVRSDKQVSNSVTGRIVAGMAYLHPFRYWSRISLKSQPMHLDHRESSINGFRKNAVSALVVGVWPQKARAVFRADVGSSVYDKLISGNLRLHLEHLNCSSAWPRVASNYAGPLCLEAL